MRTFRVLILAFILALTVLPLAAAPSRAALKYQPTGEFASTFSFLTSTSVAPDDHNDHIYVADSGSSEVLDFTSPADPSPTVWNGSTTPAGSFGGDVAVAADNSTGDVYVADANHNVIDKFDENGNLITSFGDTTPTPNGQLSGTATPAGSFASNGGYSSFPIAVDQSTHDLYVVDANHQVIDIFDENGTYLRQIVPPEGLFRYGGGYLISIAVDATTGDVFVADWAGPNEVFEFDSAGNYVKTLDGSNTPDGNFSGECTGCYLISVATDSAGKLYVASMSNRDFDVFDSSGNFLPPQGRDVGNTPSGIAVDQSAGTIYVANYGNLYVFRPIIIPDLENESPTDVTTTEAKLRGHIAPAGGGPITECHFEYETPSGPQTVPCTTEPPSSPPYSSPVSVSGAVTGLTPGTTYSYQLVAGNANGANQSEGRFATEGLYEFSSDLGSEGSGDGQLTDPQGVAVNNSTGDIYVADTGNHRVVKFDAAGEFVAAWGWGVSDGNATSEVCTSGCRAGSPGTGAGQFTTPTFVAVDNSNGPSAGDVYVADSADGVVQKFDPSGALMTAWGNDGAMSYSGGIAGIAVKSNGALVVEEGSGTGIALNSFGHIFTGQTGIAMDLSTDDRFEDTGDHIQSYTAGGTSFDAFGFGALTTAAGLALNQSTLVLYAANAGDNNIAVFSPRALPSATTNPVVNPGPESAVLTGHVDPNGGGTITDCHFEYGTDTTYALGSIPCSPAAPLSRPTNVNATVSGLTLFSTYHFRLVVTGTTPGLSTDSRDRTFTPSSGMAPTIDATSSSQIAPTEATLSAQINPNLAPTIYRFQYGTTSSYELSTVTGESIGSDDVDHSVSSVLTGLQPGTLYHYRVVALNFSGPTYGPGQTFATPDVPAIGATFSSEVGTTSALVAADLRPGYRPTTYHFEYGPTTRYGQSTPESASIGTDNEVHSVSSALSGLSPSKVYHFRIVATNDIGTTDGPDQIFTTRSLEEERHSPSSACTRHAILKNGHCTCVHGFVKNHGKCVRKPKHKTHRKTKLHKRSHK